MADEAVKSKLQLVDLNDLSLADEQIDVNPDADAFAGPAPVADGEHRVKLTLGRDKVQAGTGKQGGKYIMVNVDAVVQNPTGYGDGFHVFDRPSTMIRQGTGTCAIAGVLKALGEPVPARTSMVQLAKQLVDRLAGEPEVLMETQWEAWCADCEKVMLRTEKRFPEIPGAAESDNGTGAPTHRHQVECSKCGSLLNAQAKPIRYKAIGA